MHSHVSIRRRHVAIKPLLLVSLLTGCFAGAAFAQETGDIEEAYVYHYVPDDLGTPENPVVALAHGSWRTFMEKNNEPSNH